MEFDLETFHSFIAQLVEEKFFDYKRHAFANNYK